MQTNEFSAFNSQPEGHSSLHQISYPYFEMAEVSMSQSWLDYTDICL